MGDEPTWIVLVHHMPPRPTRLRVRVWRQLQKLGAVAVKNSVYVLPWFERTHEGFAWLQQEIEAGGGEAVLFRANALAGAVNDEIIASFRRDRDTDYARLADDLRNLGRRLAGVRRDAPAAIVALEKEVNDMQGAFNDIGEKDYFKAPGRARAAAAMARCRSLLRSARGRGAGPPARAGSKPAAPDAAKFQGRLWVTRPRPLIDRCASAWLIRRFIDRRPRFAFVAEGGKLRGGIPFDMFGAEFSHQGEDCTFETLMKRFGLERDAGVRGIARIVHDADLKDGKFGRPEAPGVDAVLRGLAEGVRDDRRLLREAEAVFDGLHATIGSRRAGGRKGARRKRA